MQPCSQAEYERRSGHTTDKQPNQPASVDGWPHYSEWVDPMATGSRTTDAERASHPDASVRVGLINPIMVVCEGCGQRMSSGERNDHWFSGCNESA